MRKYGLQLINIFLQALQRTLATIWYRLIMDPNKGQHMNKSVQLHLKWQILQLDDPDLSLFIYFCVFFKRKRERRDGKQNTAEWITPSHMVGIEQRKHKQVTRKTGARIIAGHHHRSLLIEPVPSRWIELYSFMMG